MNVRNTILVAAVLAAVSFPTAVLAQGGGGQPQEPGAAVEPDFTGASASIQQKLEQSVAELDALRAAITAEKLPLAEELRELEARLLAVRERADSTRKALDGRNLNVTNLGREIESRRANAAYLSNQLAEYANTFADRIHISEQDRYREAIDAARLAPENVNLTQAEIYAAQAALLDVSIDRLHEALGGVAFEGRAVADDGVLAPGRFLLFGPYALFRSEDGRVVGTAAQGSSTKPRAMSFANEKDRKAAADVVANLGGAMPFDPTVGQAHRIEETSETLREHIEKGGPVAIPILVMAGLSLLVALYRWIVLSLQGRPSDRQLRSLFDAVRNDDVEKATASARAMRGPAGGMLRTAVEHLRHPRELIEEVMYEQVLTARYRLNKMLPFIAICAASAPLLGLLGTVVGIIETFKLITVFGSSDVKTLSSGISAALITTELGLIVAIPSLLLHAYLSRKARAIIAHMETSAVAFLNNLAKAPRKALAGGGLNGAEPELVRMQVREILNDMLGPLSSDSALHARTS
jgi:biopolymer transport protein ExbB